MAYKVRISKEAQIEIATAKCYFRIKSLEKGFLANFSNQLRFLKTTPESFQIEYRGIRVVLFERFNYSIHYIIKDNEVFIMRILNQRQDF